MASAGERGMPHAIKGVRRWGKSSSYHGHILDCPPQRTQCRKRHRRPRHRIGSCRPVRTQLSGPDYTASSALTLSFESFMRTRLMQILGDGCPLAEHCHAGRPLIERQRAEQLSHQNQPQMIAGPIQNQMRWRWNQMRRRLKTELTRVRLRWILP
eukprot:SAG31_NODE_432_length_15773_cov_7.563892_7_plen_155_part_00